MERLEVAYSLHSNVIHLSILPLVEACHSNHISNRPEN